MHASRFQCRTRLLVATVAVFAISAIRAQTVIPSVVPVRSSPTTAGESGGSANIGVPLSNITSALSTDLPLFRRGPIAVRPHPLYRLLRGNGIEAAPGNQIETTTQTFAPGVLFEIGQHWQVDYTPIWTWYSNRAFKDSFDQSVLATGAYTYDNWHVGLSADYASTHSTLVETARQTHETRYGGGLTASCRIGQHSLVDLGVNANIREASPVRNAPEWTPSDAHDWSSSDALRYEFTSRLSASAGLTFGETRPSVGPKMTFTRPELRATWVPTEKLTFNGEMGVEQRRFSRSNTENLNTPVYSAGLHYRPVAVTTLSAELSRGTSASYFADLLAKSSGWRLGLEQRLIQLLFLGADVSEQKTTYVSTRGNLPSLRDDRYRTYAVRLSMPILRRGTVGVFWQRTRNASSLAGYGFTSRQYGLEIGFRF